MIPHARRWPRDATRGVIAPGALRAGRSRAPPRILEVVNSSALSKRMLAQLDTVPLISHVIIRDNSRPRSANACYVACCTHGLQSPTHTGCTSSTFPTSPEPSS
jgi:hypothetical protein